MNRQTSMPEFPGRSDFTACLLILTVIWLIYSQALCHDFLSNWDDSRYVVQNGAIREITLNNLKQIFTTFYVGNYAPLHLLSYMLDYSIWGLHAGGFILGNILLHGVNSLLLYLLLRFFSFGALSALIGALIFVAHPVQVESVVWISQRKNLLAMFFSLLTLYYYVRAEEGGERARFYYGLSVLTFVLALLAKSVAVMLPLTLLAYDRFWVGHRSLVLAVRGKLPYLVVALVVGILAIVSQSPEEGGGRVPYHGGSPWTTALTMVPVLVRYLRLVVWPSSLSAIYEPPIKSGVDVEVLLALGVLVLLGYTAWQLVRRRPGDGFWLVLIVTGLLPVCQIVPILTLMNDRYLYFPMLGIAGLLARLADVAVRGRGRVAVVVACAGGLALLAVLAWQRVPVWQNAMTLWNDTVIKTPGSHVAWYGLGEAFHNVGRLEEARGAYLRALVLKPFHGEVINNLAVISLDAGDPQEARRLLQPLLQQSPSDYGALLTLAGSFVMEGSYADAERVYAQAHEMNPADPKPLAGLGGVCLLSGDMSRSRKYFTQAERAGLGPDALAFHKASILSAAGRRAEALFFLDEAVRLGYRDFAGIAWDRSFDSIRKSPEYQRLIPPLARSEVPCPP